MFVIFNPVLFFFLSQVFIFFPKSKQCTAYTTLIELQMEKIEWKDAVAYCNRETRARIGHSISSVYSTDGQHCDAQCVLRKYMRIRTILAITCVLSFIILWWVFARMNHPLPRFLNGFFFLYSRSKQLAPVQLNKSKLLKCIQINQTIDQTIVVCLIEVCFRPFCFCLRSLLYCVEYNLKV